MDSPDCVEEETDADTDTDVTDVDGDGVSVDDGDCDDTDAWVYPGATDGLLANRDCVDGVLSGDLGSADTLLVGDEGFGRQVVIGGDLDGDGLADLAIAAPDVSSTNVGSVYVFLGKNLGLGEVLGPEDADWAIQSEDFAGSEGVSVAWAGDLEGDGSDDLLIGSREAQRAWVVRGSEMGAGGEVDIESVARFTLTGAIDPGFALVGLRGR